ncbi:MAG TPA: radical SAM/SPASM domain-containing protein [Burkholderiaceae bacterium]|nr:radical SAM/SPASM domain-containing protein [Burkholderiaceae bacterium]HQR69564.1 radical SAM/SPASM domain-containing protein [Burkholderiaceae bacterium]
MNLRAVGRAVRNVVIRAEVFVNRKLGREFIPATTETFYIETSSACNMNCLFCAYEGKQAPKVSMDNELFFDCVRQALTLGYREFHLTPCTGDVFMDRHAFDKLEFLDRQEGVRAYHFFTNFSILDDEQIARLVSLKKLTTLTISIYGHDEASFVALTKTSPKLYRRTLANLETLLGYRDSWPFVLTLGYRSTWDAPREVDSELSRMVERYRAAGVNVHSSHGIYSNWGGQVTQERAGGLNLHILPSAGVYKSGACVKLFDAFQVTATGVVSGCSVRDASTTLKIGDVRQQPLSAIVSKANPEYLGLIEEQESGKFRDVCRNCDFYRSIYHQPSNFRRNRIPVQGRADFLDRLGEIPARKIHWLAEQTRAAPATGSAAG